MLIDEKQIILNGAETYYTLYAGDAFCVVNGCVDVYIIMHTQEGREEQCVRVCTVYAGGKTVIPSFSCIHEDYETWCFALSACAEGAVLVRMPNGEKIRKSFVEAAHIRGYEYVGFDGCLLQYYETYAPEIVIDGAEPFVAHKPEEAYYVEAGAVFVYLESETEDGQKERKVPLCTATPQAEFTIPGMTYKSNGKIWKISIVAQNGTAKLRTIACTRMSREKFVKAVQEQANRNDSTGEMLMRAYEYEGFEESLVQYYEKNKLKDVVREERQKKEREKIGKEASYIIGSGVSGEQVGQPETDGSQALYSALKYLCRKGGIDLMEEDELSRRCIKMTPIEMARVSGFICREVVLEANWFRSDCGLLLGALDGRVVACVPDKDGKYCMFDSANGRERRLDAKTARRIHPKAYSVRRGLPAKGLTYKDLVQYVFKGIKGKDVVWAAALGVLCLLVGILLPYLNQKIYDDYIPMGDVNMLLQMCLVTGTFMIGNIFFTLVKKLYEFRIATRAGYDLQDAMFARIFRLPESFLHQYESGDLAKRVQMFGSLANTVVTKIVVTGLSTVFALLYLLQMVHYAKKLVLGAVIMVVVYALLIYVISLFALKYEKTIADKDNESCGRLQQYLGGIEKIRMAGVEERAILEYIKPVAQQQQASIRSNRISGFGDVLRDAGDTLFSMALYYLIVHNKMDLSVGSFVAFNTAFGSLSGAVMEMVDDLIEYRFLKPRLEQIKPLLESVPEADADKNLDNVEKLSGRVAFEHVTFAYSEDGATVLRDLSFDVKPGEYIGLVGRSGCGKSTIFKLLLGFETPKNGRVLYDGKDLTKLNKHSLRKRLGVVLQNGSLIAGSIYENIVITSENPSREAAERAVEKVGLKADIEMMPMHLDTVINESAGTISGGQKQRILIARAIAGNPDILLFDEATSALDNITQAKVCESLDEMNVTRIVIAHRLSTIEHCDRILVLDKGEIIEQGSYKELFERHGLFYEMAVRQIAGYEEDEEQ